MNIAEQILSKPEGGTVALNDGPLPDRGYFVGGASAPLVIRPGTGVYLPSMVEAFLKTVQSAYVGWWTDSETGLLYVDATDWFANLEIAERASRKRKEIAFWDIEGSKEIRTS